MTTLIMGIVNVTPDSFSDGGRFLDTDAAIAHGLSLIAAGADLLDVGGESTRPGAQRVDPAIERERVLPVIEALVGAGAAVSVDTMNASTAAAAIAAGALIVNDVSGGNADPEILEVVADSEAHIALGHWRGPSADMYAKAQYDNVVDEVIAELRERKHEAMAAGIPPVRIIVDPGIGFAKQGQQNWQVMRGLERIVRMDGDESARVLLGTSRKRFLAEALESLGDEPTEARRDLATAITSVRAAEAGVWAVRVHDVAATRDALRVASLQSRGGHA